MPIPRTRRELVDLVTASFEKLREELDRAGSGVADLPCVDSWTVKDLLAVRVWWTEAVLGWIDAGRKGGTPVTPAPGYGWSETPRLNARIVERFRRVSYRSLRGRLDRGFRRVLETIEGLDDRELLRPGAFAWTGRYPISRWLSINTARQYVTARSFIRRARRSRGGRRR